MIRIVVYTVVFLFLVLPALGQAPGQFTGKLYPNLDPDMVHIYRRVYSPVKDAAVFHFAEEPAKDSVLRAGELIDQRVAGGKSMMILVEPPEGDAYLWVDANANGTYELGERYFFDPPPAERYTTIIRLPIKNTFYKDFPVYVHYLRDVRNPKLAEADRLIEQSVYALANARVRIEDRSVLFQYPFEPLESSISTTEGLFGVDVDSDGRIRNEQFSVETSYAAKEEVVFPFGSMYVSTSAIDMATGAVTVRRREGSEYLRVDLAVGMEMPDFAFTDLTGKPRHLKDFRGKYLMVDFWGVWCGDCIHETPFHLEAYKRFKKRGFEILGIDSDEKIETLRGYLAKNKITWAQATAASTKRLVDTTYRIQEYPSTILLDPKGRVLVIDQKELQGEKLLQTLDRVLPR